MKIKSYLTDRHPRIYSQFARVGDNGFELVRRDPFGVWMSNKSPAETIGSVETGSIAIDTLLFAARHRVSDLSLLNRRRLVEYWKENIREDSTIRLFKSTKSAESFRK